MKAGCHRLRSHPRSWLPPLVAMGGTASMISEAELCEEAHRYNLDELDNLVKEFYFYKTTEVVPAPDAIRRQAVNKILAFDKLQGKMDKLRSKRRPPPEMVDELVPTRPLPPAAHIPQPFLAVTRPPTTDRPPFSDHAAAEDRGRACDAPPVVPTHPPGRHVPGLGHGP